LLGLAYLAVIALLALLAPWIYPGDPLDIVATPLLAPFTDPAYPLGTDALGRDIISGLVHGARISLTIGVLSTALGVSIGLVVGAISGYFGGVADMVLSRIVEIFQTLPSFVLLIVLVAITETSVGMIIVAIGLIHWTTIARLVRAEFRTLKESDFVMAGRSLGYGHGHIIFREILPNALPPVIVTTSVMIASAILMESALSFMGFGDPNVISWGSMIGAGREYLRSAWFLTAIPGLAIVLTVLAFNVIGDGLNDALNPRSLEEK
jgi:peptide/nickel transport system permease protein